MTDQAHGQSASSEIDRLSERKLTCRELARYIWDRAKNRPSCFEQDISRLIENERKKAAERATRPVPAPVGLEREEMRSSGKPTQNPDSRTWTAGIDVMRQYPFQDRQWHLHAIEFHHKDRIEAERLRDATLAALSPDHRTEPASAPIGPRSAGQSETGELVEFFRGEGYSWFGFNGDENGWTPERTAVEAMRDFIRWRLANPKANIPHCQSPVECDNNRPHDAPEWLWYGEVDGKQVVTFGRWPKRGAKWRYKWADVQPTEHDKRPCQHKFWFNSADGNTCQACGAVRSGQGEPWRAPDTLEQRILSAVRVWRDCPEEKRPSPDALAATIILACRIPAESVGAYIDEHTDDGRWL